jgi:hypothetical protein
VRRRNSLALLVLLGLTVLVPSAGADTPTISQPVISGTAGANGWYVSNVTVTYEVTGSSFNQVACGTWHTTSQGLEGVFTFTSDGAQQPATCSVISPSGSSSSPPLSINIDKTTPAVASVGLSRGPDSNGWYNHPVQIAATGTASASGIASCTSATYAGPDSSSAAVSATCTSGAGLVSAPKAVSFQYDATPPSVSVSPARAADANGWYNHPVGVAFTGADAVSGIDTCSGSTTYSGPDSGSASVVGSCRDKAGNSASATFALKYDATPPTVTGATPDRPPDAGGFYNHKVVVTFAGTDSTSGISSCDTVTYDKPDSQSAKVTGVCHDNAGNVSSQAPFAFKYDSTPPKLSGLTAAAENGRVDLSWNPSPDVASLVVTRSTGGAAPKTVYSGTRIATFADRNLRNGVRYTYTVIATDDAGNAATMKTTAQPSTALIAPSQQAHVRGSVLLRWRSASHAGYYNVQLWRSGTKVLSSWPSGPSFRIARTWSYLGRSYNLAPGRYTWFVWPGRGKPTEHSFGPLLGSSSFVVTG